MTKTSSLANTISTKKANQIKSLSTARRKVPDVDKHTNKMKIKLKTSSYITILANSIIKKLLPSRILLLIFAMMRAVFTQHNDNNK